MLTLHINGQTQTFDGDPSMPLLWYLRDVLGLTGTFMACRSPPGFPELRKHLEIMRACSCSAVCSAVSN
jgi:aerobic-type carbon monoxide dehydrogenase small subunit (CoxS/CutS family)